MIKKIAVHCAGGAGVCSKIKLQDYKKITRSGNSGNTIKNLHPRQTGGEGY